MSLRTAEHLDAVRHLPAGATLIFRDFGWDEYERLLEDLSVEGSHVRVSYDRGKLEIMSPLPEHEVDARFVDILVRTWSETRDLKLENFGSATWKRRSLAKGVEPDACYYVRNADRIIGRRTIDLEPDPPPDIVVEIDITTESRGKFSIYTALGVPEIWCYDGKTVEFYELRTGVYENVLESPSFPGLKPAMLAHALEQSKSHGQTVALAAFRQQLPSAHRS